MSFLNGRRTLALATNAPHTLGRHIELPMGLGPSRMPAATAATTMKVVVVGFLVLLAGVPRVADRMLVLCKVPPARLAQSRLQPPSI